MHFPLTENFQITWRYLTNRITFCALLLRYVNQNFYKFQLTCTLRGFLHLVHYYTAANNATVQTVHLCSPLISAISSNDYFVYLSILCSLFQSSFNSILTSVLSSVTLPGNTQRIVLTSASTTISASLVFHTKCSAKSRHSDCAVNFPMQLLSMFSQFTSILTSVLSLVTLPGNTQRIVLTSASTTVSTSLVIQFSTQSAVQRVSTQIVQLTFLCNFYQCFLKSPLSSPLCCLSSHFQEIPSG